MFSGKLHGPPQNNSAERMERVREKLGELECSGSRAEKEKRAIEEQIIQLKEDAIRNIEESAKTLLEQVRSVYDRWHQDLNKDMGDLRSYLAHLQSYHGNGRQTDDVKRAQLHEGSPGRVVKPPTVEFVPKAFERSVFTLGQIRVKENKGVDSPRQEVVSPLKTPSPRTFTTRKSRFGTPGTKKGQFSEPLCVTTALDEVYVIDRTGGGRVQVFTLMGEQVSEFMLNLGEDLTINGCGLHSDGTYISFVGSLYKGIIGVNKVYSNVFTKYRRDGRQIVQRALSVGSDRDPVLDACGFADGRLAVALTGKVGILGTNGEKLSEFDTAVQVYKRVCVDHRNSNILLSLHKNIQIYNVQGQKLRDLSLERGAGSTPLTGPHGLCVDGTGNIIVADWSTSRVQMFSSEGGLVKTIAGEEDGLVCPWDVTVPRKGCVVVIDWRQHCVFVFRY